MSIPDDHAFRKGLVIGLSVASLIFISAYACYQVFGPRTKMPELPLLIGEIRQVRADAEAMVRSAKSRWKAGLVADHDLRSGADLYRGLSSRCDGIAATLEAMLSAGHDDGTLAELRNRLEGAQAHYNSFRAWAARLPNGQPVQPPGSQAPGDGPILYGAGPTDIVTDLIKSGADLGKHVFDKMVDLDREKRDHLIEMLRACRFATWREITEDTPSDGNVIISPLAPSPAPSATRVQPKEIWPRRLQQQPM